LAGQLQLTLVRWRKLNLYNGFGDAVDRQFAD
jgi:hypothetical protein